MTSYSFLARSPSSSPLLLSPCRKDLLLLIPIKSHKDHEPNDPQDYTNDKG